MNENSNTPNFSDDELAFLESVFELAREGQTENLATLLSQGIPVNLTNSRGDTLLILAAYHRRIDTVTMLLDADADVTRSNDMGQTALAAATFRNDEGIVLQLLQAGADPNFGQQSALAVAKQFGLVEMESLLSKYVQNQH